MVVHSDFRLMPIDHPHSLTNGNLVSSSSSGTVPTSASQKEFPIAIVGMSCRFAGDATSPSKLWDLCVAGKDSWSPIPKERFDIKAWYHNNAQKAGRTHVKGGYFLSEDIALFDAAFFKFSGDMATALDPQIRLLLEGFYEATEDAGIPIENLAGSNTSVFTGCFSKDYHEVQVRDPELLSNSTSGVGTAMLSNRISHFYDLQGASMSIDTGCSGSMVALHQACRSIWSGDSDVSVVAGADALLNQDSFIAMSTLGVLSEDGRCFAWDSRANGFGRAEGVAVLLLKPLSTALQDGDRIHSVIRASGLNQDGKTATISSPSMDAQIKLIEETYRRAGLDIRETGYVEAHMTGTSTGDPIEAEALARTFGQSRQVDDPIFVGSVKTNIGHTEPVSGVASVIKTSFVLRDGLIPPNLNYEVPHKSIPLEKWHMQVPTALTPWPKDKLLRASINNFGYGGTNAHVIMERAPVVTPRPLTNGSFNGNGNGPYISDRSLVYILSAKDSSAVKAMALMFVNNVRQSINNGHLISPDDLAYTLAERRSRFPWRATVSARNLEELCDRWESPTMKAVNSTRRPVKRLGFVFNGQGAQWHAMARELIHTYPVFGRKIQEAGRILKEFGAEWSLYDELMRDEHSTRVHEVDLSQPLTVSIQLCLVDLLKSWGITPSAVTSHSSGEIAAAYTVGALTFKEALVVIYYRGQLALKLQKLGSLQGSMAAVGLGAEAVEKYIANVTAGGHVLVACINSPNSVTLSGDSGALDEVVNRLEKDGVFAKRLRVPLAYHSHHMSHIAEEYAEHLRANLPEAAKSWDGVLFSSPVTGQVVTSAKVLSPSHWARNLTSPVLFSQAFENMCFGPTGPNVDMLVEIGAHSTLSGPIRQILKSRGVEMPYASCLKRSVDAVATMQELVCELLGRDYPVSLESVNFPLSRKNYTYRFVPDLPTYPWNHKTRYWDEPRLSRELRSKKFPPHELLGSLFTGVASNKPTWRNFLRLSEMEWLRDHQIESQIVLPGAYYISMAIEAVRLLADHSEETIRGYRLRDVEIMNALVVPESLAVETQLSLRRCNEKELEHVGWYEFELCSLAVGDFWVENCKGYVSAETGDAIKAVTTRELTPPFEDLWFASTNSSEMRKIDTSSLFSRLHEMGIQHGPGFQNLIDSKATDSKGITNFVIADVASTNHEYVLHPTTLDSIFQSTFCCLPEARVRAEIVLPRSIRTMFVPKHFKRKGGDKLKAFTELVSLNQRGLTSSISVVDTDVHDKTKEPFFQIQDFFCQAVPRDKDDESPEATSICSKSCWQLDILHNVPAAVKESMRIPMQENDIDEERKRVRASFYFVHDAVCELEAENPDVSTWVWHHKLFYDWMKSLVALADSGRLRAGSKLWSKTTKGLRQRLYDELEAASATDQLLVRVGQKLAAIVRGEVTTLELMMEANLLNRYYSDNNAATVRVHKHAGALAELYAMKEPGANILEIGAGTGGGTKTVLEAFDARGKMENLEGSLVGHYTFTDISQGFFAAAREKFAAWEGMMDFKQLDIEEDPIAQGFKTETYDLIVAAMVLHATKNLHRTLSHVRQLLKPGGKLLLIESTKDRLDTQVAFGPLPGWWLGEEPERKNSPNVSVQRWGQLLQETGFSGIDFDIYDYEEDEFQSASTILSTAVSIEMVRGPISIVHDTIQTPPQPWLSQLCDRIRAQTGASPSIESLDQVQVQDKICIFTAELKRPFLDGIDGPSFEKLRNLVINSRGVLWLSSGSLVDGAEPSFAATQGLLRTLRLEDTSKRYVHLDFERILDGDEWTGDMISHIVHVLQQSFKDSIDEAGIECEFAVKDSMLRVVRLIPDKFHSRLCSNMDTDPKPELQLFFQPGRPLVWETSRSGLLSDLHFTDKLDLAGNVPSGFVEVEAKAFGVNFRDVLVALGQLDETFLAHECGGIITRLGPDTEESGLQVGDRVCSFSTGRYASTARAHWTSVVKIPADMSYEWAATIPVAYATAYHSLFHIARLQKGESVLIHAAAGGFGQAAVVLAQYAGAEIFATCSSEAKRDLLVTQYNIPSDHILSSRDSSFAPAIMTLTDNKGVDVVLNSLSGALLKVTWDCVARFGRFIEVGKIDMEAARRLDLTPFRRCATFASVDLMQLREYNRLLMREAIAESVRICHERSKTPILPITQYSISDVEKAMRLMQAGKHMGKLILVPAIEDKVKVVSRLQPVSLNDTHATYLIVGGVTGIGSVVTEWMLSKGAKTLLLVSRHATTHPNALKLQAQGEVAGCSVHIRDCDVADENSLVKLLAECSRTLPPIRGVVNGAMVLDDTVFEHMTWEQWSNGIRPKINSSRNLHQHLPKDLSFFIMLSSSLGVCGATSQANYVAGNAYQDALSRHRNKIGLPAVTIDLCVIRKVGYVETRVDGGDDGILARFAKLGFGEVDVAAVLRLLEAAIRDPFRASPEDSQIVMGITEHTANSWARENMVRDRRFGALQLANRRGRGSSANSSASSTSSTAALVRVLSAPSTTVHEASNLLVEALSIKLADMFNIPLSEVDVGLPLSRYGVDSLVAVELRNWLSSAIKARVSVFEILQSPSLVEFGTLLATKSEYISKVVAMPKENGDNASGVTAIE